MTLLENLPLLKSSTSEESQSSFFTEDSRAAEKKRQQIAGWAVAEWDRSKTDRSKQERQWYINLAFYFGQHYVRPRGTGRNFDLWVPNAPYYKVRPVINYVRKFVRKDISRLTSQQPNAYVVPASSDDRDLFAAQASEQVWDSLYHTKKLHKKIRQAVFWATTCGNGFMKQWWDDDVVNPDFAPEEEMDAPAGDVDFSSESPFHIFVPDLLAEDIEDQPWTIHTKQVTPEWVKQMYGVEVSQDAASADTVNSRLMSVMDVNASNRGKLMLLEVCVKPGATDLLPEGGYFTLAGSSQMLYGGEGPLYGHNEYPYSKIDAMPSGKFYSDSVVYDLIPLQRELNRTVGQVIEAKNRMAKPQLVAEEGSVDATKITTEPGQLIYYRGGYNPPQPLPLQNLPSYVLEQIDRDLAFMSDLSGQHEVTKGQVPPGVTAATAISYLQEADDSLLSTVFDSVEEAVEKTARQSLHLVRDYWSIPRLVKVTGSDGTFDAMMLKGSQLVYDIRVEGGSALPTSKAARQAFIMDMMTRGFINPEEGLSVMEMGGLNKIYDRIQVDIKQVQRENIKLKSVREEDLKRHIEEWQAKVEEQDPVAVDQDTGMTFEAPPIIPVNSYDNHELHIEYHNRYRKSQSFEMVPDFIKAVFEEHVAQHEEILQMAATATQLQGQNPLTPPGEEGGSTELEEGGGQPGPEPMPEEGQEI